MCNFKKKKWVKSPLSPRETTRSAGTRFFLSRLLNMRLFMCGVGPSLIERKVKMSQNLAKLWFDFLKFIKVKKWTLYHKKESLNPVFCVDRDRHELLIPYKKIATKSSTTHIAACIVTSIFLISCYFITDI